MVLFSDSIERQSLQLHHTFLNSAKGSNEHFWVLQRPITIQNNLNISKTLMEPENKEKNMQKAAIVILIALLLPMAI